MPSVILAGTTTGTALSLTSDTSGELQIRTNNGSTTAMTLTTGGNVGVGVAPSAWSGVGSALQIGLSAAIIGNSASSSSFISNAYFDGTNYRYINTGTASRLAMTSANYVFTSAGSGTAGNVVTFAESMRIDSSGNVGIGISSPVGRLDVSGLNDTGGVTALIRNTSDIGNTTPFIDLRFSQRSNGADNGRIRSGREGIYDTSPATMDSFMAFYTAINNTDTERMRITSNGNLLVGGTTSTDLVLSQIQSGSTSNTSAGLQILTSTVGTGGLYYGDSTTGTARFQGFIEYSNGSDSMTFGTNTAERMRITSGGYLKASNNGSYVGVSDEGHELRGTTGSNILRVNANNTSFTSVVTSLECTRNTSNNTYFFIQATRVGSADVFRVADSGNCTNTNGSYGTISDVKLKENIIDATPKLDKINQLQVRNYNFIGDDLKQIGFVAQEFEQVFPSMVEESADKDKDGNDLGTTTKTIKTTVLIPVLVKAIQEQQTLIENLTTRLNALEGN